MIFIHLENSRKDQIHVSRYYYNILLKYKFNERGKVSSSTILSLAKFTSLFPFLSFLSLYCQPRYILSVTSFSFYFPPSFPFISSSTLLISRETVPTSLPFRPRTSNPPFNWLRSHLWPPLSLFRGCSPRGVTAPSTVTNDPVEFRGGRNGFKSRSLPFPFLNSATFFPRRFCSRFVDDTNVIIKT